MEIGNCNETVFVHECIGIHVINFLSVHKTIKQTLYERQTIRYVNLMIQKKIRMKLYAQVHPCTYLYVHKRTVMGIYLQV